MEKSKELIDEKQEDVVDGEGDAVRTEFERIQKIVALCNREPEKEFVLTHDEGFKYLPISFIETAMDEIFFGQWSVKGFKYEQFQNELVGSLEIEIISPINGRVITRTGTGSVLVYEGRSTCLTLGVPRLKTECIKNAVQSLGKYFGRDLNREIFDNYDPMIKPKKEEKQENIVNTVLKKLSEYKGDDKDEIKALCVDRMNVNEFTDEFANEILERLSS